MFNGASKILHTLLIEGSDRFPGVSPLRKGTEIFAYLLNGLPAGQGPYPGVFGLEELMDADRAAWETRIQAAASREFIYAEEPPAFTAFRELGFSVDDGGRGHITIDYGQILRSGLKGIVEQLDPAEDFDRAVRDSLLAVKDFAARYRCSVPWEPAHDLHDALQSVWLVYECLVLSEHVSWSYSWGRMDRYLQPYVSGMTREEMRREFVMFFRFLNQVNFKDDACALNIGGEEGFNELTRAIIEAAAEVHLPAPLLTVRVAETLPDADFELLLRKELLTCGQPTFYGEESCRRALKRRGIPEDDIPNWAANSCMGLMIPGKEWQVMWGAVLQMTTALELALNGGSFFRMPPPVPLNVPPMANAQYTGFEALYAQVLRYIQSFFTVFVNAEREKCASGMAHLQNAFAAAFHEDCLSRKKEMRNGGIRYFTLIVETMGLANLADSLYTVRQLVYERKKTTLDELCTALKTDFVHAQGLLAEIMKLPKYGQHHPEADAMMRRLAADVAEIAAKFSGNGFFCAPSLHTLNTHVGYGQAVEATADGRRAHAPLAKNAGTVSETQAAHTERILSAVSWDQTGFSGGQPLDLWIDPAEWETEAGRKAYAKLFRTYLENGGLQLQINGADIRALQDAMEHPEKYPDLTVRIGGFSMRFVQMSRIDQLDFIRRFARGM